MYILFNAKHCIGQKNNNISCILHNTVCLLDASRPMHVKQLTDQMPYCQLPVKRW